MRAIRAATIVVGLMVFAGLATAAGYKLKETASIADVPVGQLQSGVIVFSDRAAGSDSAGIFTPYAEWAKAKPLEQQILGLYPGYSEPNTMLVINGARRRFREKLHMYVAEARFLLSRPPASIALANYVGLSFVERLDPAIKHKLLTRADPPRPKQAKTIYNQPPSRHWCEGRPVVICLRSVYKLEGRLPAGIHLANKLREGGRKISDKLEFDSEFTLLSPAEVDAAQIEKLTGIATPSIGALQQSIFYVNQVIQFGKLLAVFQQDPSDAGRTVVSVFTALAIESNILGKRKQYAKIPVLRNLVPIQVLSGKSSFNTGKSLSAGLPVYARNQIEALAGILNGP